MKCGCVRERGRGEGKHLRSGSIDDEKLHAAGELPGSEPDVDGRLLFVSSEYPHPDPCRPQVCYGLRHTLRGGVEGHEGREDIIPGLTFCSLSSMAVAPSNVKF